MPEIFQQAVPQAAEILWDDLLLRLVLAMLLGSVVAATYYLTQWPNVPVVPSFVATLVLLCILIAFVTQVIGGNVARAFSLVGALSIIRFRTVVEDTRDTAFVIFAVVVGMAAGAANPVVAVVGLGVVGLAAGLLRLLPHSSSLANGEWNLQLRVAMGFGGELPWESVFTKHCRQAQLVSTASARQGAAFDFTYKLKLRADSTPMLLLSDLNRLEGIQNVELPRT